jgi:phenylpropionate dioxygenase-like ring-hydroxylating dioxygenase large terminal subunit
MNESALDERTGSGRSVPSANRRLTKDAWYVAATTEELSKSPVVRRVLDLPVFLYRGEPGAVTAMLDRCPHRRFPLSKGLIEDGGVRCGYHGLKFAADGRCIDIPCQKEIQKGLRIRTFETRELGDWVWIWMGDEPSNGRAPPQAPEFLQSTGWQRHQLTVKRVAARASLLHDNLLDLSHLSYLHSSTIGNTAVVETRPVMTMTRFGLSVRREIYDTEMSNLPLGRAVGISGPIVRVMDSHFHAPSLHITGSAFFQPDQNRKPSVEVGNFRVFHALTPEKSDSTHYFLSYQRDFGLDDPAVHQAIEAITWKALPEDIMAVELIEAELAAAVDLEAERHIAADFIGLRGRKLLEELASGERGAGVVAPVA